MPLFSPKRTIKFAPIDPLGGGLREDIAREQNESEVIKFQQDLDGPSLVEFWEQVASDMHGEPGQA